MNLCVLRKSRHTPRPGDLFTYRIKTKPYGFGRVIATDALIGGISDVILIYIYDYLHQSPVPKDLPLSPPRLLLPPEPITRSLWTRGYFQHLENIPLSRKQLLPRHCFWTDLGEEDMYFDDYGRRLRRRNEPCGFYSVNTFMTIDATLSEALGIEPSPETIL